MTSTHLGCHYCGSNDSFIMPRDPYSHDHNDRVVICAECPYINCDRCAKAMTIEESGETCFCGTFKGCHECVAALDKISCNLCDVAIYVSSCGDECKNKIKQYFDLQFQLCNKCFATGRCSHHPKNDPSQPFTCDTCVSKGL